MTRKNTTLGFLLILLTSCSGLMDSPPQPTPTRRERSLPPQARKITPGQDPHPPQIHHPAWEAPQPVPGPINTAGGEDSPFIPSGGEELYFFFTPDVSLPPERQLSDGQTGLYRSQQESGGWGEPQRLVLNDDVALDGCPFVLEDALWFCSARPGSTGVSWFKAVREGQAWVDWEPVSFPESYQVGEFHITSTGDQLFFGSSRPGSEGGSDLWVSRRSGEEWGEPVNLHAVNSGADESRPYLTADGKELWFTRTYQGSPGVFRSVKKDQDWSPPELILSPFAGEPTLDPEGNIYFVHHYFLEGEMAEADLYLARKK